MIFQHKKQETLHHLRSLKMHTLSFTVISVCLDGSRRIRTDGSESSSTQFYLIFMQIERH